MLSSIAVAPSQIPTSRVWEKEMHPTPVLLPREFRGQRSLVGCCPWGRTESDMTEVTQYAFMHWRRKWQCTPVFLPGESQGQRSLVGCHLWGRTESDTIKAIQQQQQQHTEFHAPISQLALTLSGILFSQIGISSRLLLKCHNLRKNFPDHSFQVSSPLLHYPGLMLITAVMNT